MSNGYDRHAAKRYEEGASLRQIATEMYHGSVIEARKGIVAGGGTIRRPGRPKVGGGLTLLNREIYEAYQRDGATMADIAAQFGITRQRVCQHVNKVEAYIRGEKL